MQNSIDYRQALEAAQMADAVIYPIVVVPITNDAGRSLGGEHVLSLMAQGTGGRTFAAALGAELDQAFSDIISELRTQYMLAYYPHGVPPTTERFHKLQVSVKRPELQVSARNGYYGEIEERKSESDARISITPERPAPPPPPDRKKRTDK
jgi:Ca-activated chloride channel family protein